MGEKAQEEPAARIREKKVIAFCGIARPERFSSLLKKQGIYPELFLKFPDHYYYPPSSLEKIIKKFQIVAAEALITTEKDAVKIADSPRLRKIPAYYLKIDIEVEKEFYKKVLSFIKNEANLDYSG